MIHNINRNSQLLYPSWPQFSEDEIDIVKSILQSGKVNYWTGTHGRQFEEEYAAFLNLPYAIAMMNGTVALEAAIMALGIGPGDEVISTSRTFIASSSAYILHGAKPVFVDVDPVSQNINIHAIEEAITPNTKAILAVHLAGWPCDMPELLKIARKHHLYVIEDCAQAHGASINGQPVGSFGDVATFSFCQDKIITTGGEGGMAVTRNEQLYNKMWELKDHGKSLDALKRQHPPGFRWLHESFGTNWRMTEIQAAIGRIQLKKLTEWVQVRQRNAHILQKALSGFSALRLTTPPPHYQHSYYRYYIFIETKGLKPNWNRDKIMMAINEKKVPCFSGSCSEIYREKAFIDANLHPPARLPVAKELGETSLVFLVHPTLDTQHMQEMAKHIVSVISEASADKEQIAV